MIEVFLIWGFLAGFYTGVMYTEVAHENPDTIEIGEKDD